MRRSRIVLGAVDDLALDKFENQRKLLDSLLSPQEPTAIHAAVLATCGQYDSPAVADLILVALGAAFAQRAVAGRRYLVAARTMGAGVRQAFGQVGRSD